MIALGAQVRSFDKQVAEVAGDVGVREIVFMQRAGSEERNASVLPAAMFRQRRLHVVEERRETDAVAALEEVARDVRMNDAIGESEANTGQRLCVIVDDPPSAVVPAGKIGRIELQAAGLGQHALCRTDKGRVGENEFRGQEPLTHEMLGTVQIIEDGIR